MHLKDKNQVVLVDPREEHLFSLLSFMDQEKLKIRSILLTSDEKEYVRFMEDLRPISRAFTENFKVYAGFK